MAKEDFDYFLIPFSSKKNETLEYTTASGDNGSPHTEENSAPYTYSRKYETTISTTSVTYFSRYTSPYIVQANFIKNAKLQELGLLDNEGKILLNNKIISIRAKVKISPRTSGYKTSSNNSALYYLYRSWVGLSLFSDELDNINTYIPNIEGIENFYYNLPPQSVTKEGQTLQFPGWQVKAFSGYNLVLCHDGPGAANLKEMSTDQLWTPEKTHLSLYSYGTAKKPSDWDLTNNRHLQPLASNSYKLYECTTPISQPDYSTGEWYNIRLDVVPVTSTSIKLISYVYSGDLWYKVGEVIHDEFSNPTSYKTNGRIGFITGFFDTGTTDYTYVGTQHRYLRNNTTYVDDFSIYVEDI